MMRGSKTDEIMTLAFMILAIAAGVCYFAFRGNFMVFLIVGGVAILLRLVQYALRFFL
jgi:hypothetical protein